MLQPFRSLSVYFYIARPYNGSYTQPSIEEIGATIPIDLPGVKYLYGTGRIGLARLYMIKMQRVVKTP